jgi:hypothetical protein
MIEQNKEKVQKKEKKQGNMPEACRKDTKNHEPTSLTVHL